MKVYNKYGQLTKKADTEVGLMVDFFREILNRHPKLTFRDVIELEHAVNGRIGSYVNLFKLKMKHHKGQ